MLALVFLWLLAAGCAAHAPVADLAKLNQDPAAYAAEASFPAWRLNSQHQRWLATNYMAEWFSVWTGAKEMLSPQEVRDMAGKAAERPGLGPNLRPHPDGWLAGLWREAGLADYPNAGYAAITAKPCDLRVLPCSRPDFAGDEPGSGYPFDRLQQTSLPPGVPLRVVHRSASGAWLLVASPWAWGWLEAGAVAVMDQSQVQRFMARPMVTVIRDQSPLRDAQGRLLLSAPMGALFPLAGQTQGGWQVLAALRGADGIAESVTGILEAGSAARFPKAMDTATVASLASRLAGQAYGWGGLFGLRDCSAMTKDLMAPFGLWLDRNSSDQAKGGARFIDLSAMDGPSKERAIAAQGIPFLSLLWMPGHVMLYIGQHKGRALVLHNLWALRVAEGFDRQGRLIIGKAVVTTLTPGAERADLVRPEGLLIERLQGLVLLVPPEAVEPQ